MQEHVKFLWTKMALLYHIKYLSTSLSSRPSMENFHLVQGFIFIYLRRSQNFPWKFSVHRQEWDLSASILHVPPFRQIDDAQDLLSLACSAEKQAQHGERDELISPCDQFSSWEMIRIPKSLFTLVELWPLITTLSIDKYTLNVGLSNGSLRKLEKTPPPPPPLLSLSPCLSSLLLFY